MHSQTVPAMSGLRFIAGSHHWGRRFVPQRFFDRPRTTSAPYEPNGLTPGDTLGDDPRFPLVVGNDAEDNDQAAPRPVKTTPTVLAQMRRSWASDQLST